MTTHPSERLDRSAGAEQRLDRPAGAEQRLDRFDRAERALHWVNAALFAVLLVTAAVLYIGPLSVVVGRRAMVRDAHVVAGLAFPVPLLAAWLGPRRAALRADWRALARWDADDRAWARSRGRARVRMGKFHPGQKLNAAFTLGALAVLLVSGAVLHWFSRFPDDWRTGATFVHDWTAIVTTVVVAGHLKMAFSDRDALRAMVRGWVPAEWARRHRPAWYEAETGTAAQEPVSVSTDVHEGN